MSLCICCISSCLTNCNASYVIFYNIYGSESLLISAKYLFDLGTTPGSADVVSNIAMPYTVTSHCVDGLHLQHKRVYYSSVTAFNGGIVEKNVTVSSDGGKPNYRK